MNVIKHNNNIIRFESYWRSNKNDNLIDSNGLLFPYPKEGEPWTDKFQFTERLKTVQKMLKLKNKYYLKDNKNCLLCNKQNITSGIYQINNIAWEDGLVHYIDTHNIKPSSDFIDFIYNINFRENKSKSLKIDGTLYKMNDLKYIKLDRNQIMIMDALMMHGGYTKKYVDEKKKMYRYSEHAGLIDFNDNNVDKIIISGRTNRIDKGDEEIYLPKNMPDAYDYEYIFHTHPPTPKPGGRADIGILYEFPSISDIFHFVDHYNEGKTQGSLVIAPEGLYNIRNLNLDKKKIKVNEDELYKKLMKAMSSSQKKAIKKYGIEFSNQTFYSVISQDHSYIKDINNVLNNYSLQIDYFSRIRDDMGEWILDTIHLPVYVIEPI